MKFAFTLVELLVVVSIIGLLVSIVLASLNSARIKSRDTRRVSDIREIRSALELYYTDNQEYPDDIYATSGSITGKYIAVVSKDPRGTNYPYNALQINSASPADCVLATGKCFFYHLGALLENGLPGGPDVLKSDRDLYKGAPVPTARDFEGFSVACNATESILPTTDDGCYDIAP